METSFWWDFAWGAAVAEVTTPANGAGVDDEWHSFETDYIERHKDMNGFHPRMERYSMETRDCTKATVKSGDLLLGLAGTALAVVLSEAEGDGNLIRLALMVGSGDAPGVDIARVAYQKVLSLDFLAKDSLAGDCYKSGQFPYQSMTPRTNF
ncbi:hypothetical protein M409DRAFT_58244 [Zasmidium cellare ATCC 36951]|uniref:Uncharacterized protein n=1 Tax=Zasmidium cellare ATCC 36951 TaxID=1080233 RepID=A0A6A6C5V3_ZASCE|nr:uncharacterized protein M409DRAFT_58244 [Zasmidium cellare ATCC 36951]KAF2162484.1 hypothetical protein M409DRAFT_58244 [Zasmidium cellare ATCC 36951]